MRKTYLYPFTHVARQDFQMVPKSGNPIPAYQFHLLQKFSDRVAHAVFTRAGGVSTGAYESLNVRFGIGDKEANVKKNRLRIGHCFGKDDGGMIAADQTHSNNVIVVDYNHLLYTQKPWDAFEDIDGFVTNTPQIPLMIQVADCQALLFYDPVRNIIAAAHAGWKGLVQDISGETIEIMKKKFESQPTDILVGISPSLGPCCSFFSDPEKELPKNFHTFIDKQKRVNLWNFSIEQLQSHGIAREHIELAKVCTQCGGDGSSLQKQNILQNWKNPYFSFRGQQGITGRFGVVIALE